MSRLTALNISTRSSLIKPLIASSFRNPIKQYSGHHNGEEKEELIEMERAQSTAEVMQKLSDDKEEQIESMEQKSHQGFASQTSDKFVDAAQEAVGEPNPEAIKEKYKRGGSGETYHKPRDDGGIGSTSI